MAVRVIVFLAMIFSRLVPMPWFAMARVVSRACLDHASHDGHSKPRQRAGQRLLGETFPVELHMYHPRGTRRRFEHPRQRAQTVDDGLRAPLVTDAFDLPLDMAETLGDLRAGRLRDLADPRQRQHVRVVVDAQLGGRGALAGAEMHLVDAGAPLQLVDQSPNAGVRSVRNARQDHRDVEAELVCHDGFGQAGEPMKGGSPCMRGPYPMDAGRSGASR
ncbi:hypothetical protein ACA040_001244 [Xenophilus aerolatus]